MTLYCNECHQIFEKKEDKSGWENFTVLDNCAQHESNNLELVVDVPGARVIGDY